MAWGGRLGLLKAETTAAIQSLSEQSEFSIVAFGSTSIAWSPFPKTANAGNRADASLWVQALSAVGSTCLVLGGVEAIQISNLSQKGQKQILVLSDGVPGCSMGSGGAAETLTVLTAANWQHTPINTIYISSDSAGVTFMQQLAAQNGGVFRQVQ